MKTGIELIAAERFRQIEKEGWSVEHDDEHILEELASAGAYYALPEETIEFLNDRYGSDTDLHLWPFELEWRKTTPNDRVKQLSKAGALIAAEIDRLNRLNLNKVETPKNWKEIMEYYPKIGLAYDIKLRNGKEYLNVLFDMDDDSSYFETEDGLIPVSDVSHFTRELEDLIVTARPLL